MILNARKKYVAVKIENTAGTAESLSDSDFALLAFDPQINQNTSFTSRTPAGMGPGQLKGVPEERMGTASFQIEVKGSGTAGTLPKWAEQALIASGFKDDGTGVLNPIIALADQKPATIGIYEDGLLKKLRGAMANATIEGEFGKRALISFEFSGIWVAPSDMGTEPAPTLPSESPLRVAAATFNIASAAKKISNFSLDLGNDIQMRPSVADESGLAHAYLADRAPTISFDPEADLVANDDVFGDWIGGTEAALSINLGSTSGNQVGISGDRLQYIDPQETTRQGMIAHEMSAQLNAASGNDEISFDFSS